MKNLKKLLATVLLVGSIGFALPNIANAEAVWAYSGKGVQGAYVDSTSIYWQDEDHFSVAVNCVSGNITQPNVFTYYKANGVWMVNIRYLSSESRGTSSAVYKDVMAQAVFNTVMSL